MSLRPSTAAALVFLNVLLRAPVCGGQTADEFAVRAADAAASIEMLVDSADGARLEFRPKPILRWTNPVPEKRMHGEVFLWTDDGRPAAVLNLFQMDEGQGPKDYYEFCSLAGTKLSAANTSGLLWRPSKSPVTLSPLVDAMPPAASARQRLTQMRELAARFTCRKTNRKEETQTLRLLAQPLVRYERESQGITDGGLFVFVEATDPEAFLLLEAHTVNKVPAWRFGFARMASVEMRASLDDKVEWEVATLPYTEYRNRPDMPYTLLVGPRP
jgi:hypothetical protein